ncbi:hypothetical protein AUJ77_01535, partial [Candidatus Nomurabacteria bacterium CG1_02_43_90]
MKIFNKGSVALLAVFFALGFFGLDYAFAAGPASVNLGTAGNFTILSKTGISTTGTTLVVGDMGVSPVEATYITGFSLNLPSGSAYATSPLVAGKVYAPGYANPTPVVLTTAIGDMQTAYTDAQGRTNPTATELGAGNIGGMTLTPGLYKWGTGITIPTDVTLAGSANDIWIFQIAQNLDVSSGVKVLLSGGAQASNIFWVVAGQTTLGTTAVLNGNVLDQTAIVLNTGAVANGRLLAQTAVTLDANTVSASSAPAVIPVVPVVLVTPVVSVIATPVMSAVGGSVSSVVFVPSSNSVQVSCPQGESFSRTNGQRCTDNDAIGVGHVFCPQGNLFSKTTGQECTDVSSNAVQNNGSTVA